MSASASRARSGSDSSALKKYRRVWALSRALDNAHYLDSRVIWSESSVAVGA